MLLVSETSGFLCLFFWVFFRFVDISLLIFTSVGGVLLWVECVVMMFWGGSYEGGYPGAIGIRMSSLRRECLCGLFGVCGGVSLRLLFHSPPFVHLFDWGACVVLLERHRLSLESI